MEQNNLLHGADAIASYLGVGRRKVYFLAEKHELPIFKLGGRLVARKSTLDAHFAALERAAAGASKGEAEHVG